MKHAEEAIDLYFRSNGIDNIPTIFFFWDKKNDSPDILGEDGEFCYYSEDTVAIDRGSESGRKWWSLNKLKDVTPLNTPQRFEILDPTTNEWVQYTDCSDVLAMAVQKHAGDTEWQEVF